MNLNALWMHDVTLISVTPSSFGDAAFQSYDGCLCPVIGAEPYQQ